MRENNTFFLFSKRNFTSGHVREPCMLSSIHIFRKSDSSITFCEIGPGRIRMAGCNVNTDRFSLKQLV